MRVLRRLSGVAVHAMIGDMRAISGLVRGTLRFRLFVTFVAFLALLAIPFGTYFLNGDDRYRLDFTA